MNYFKITVCTITIAGMISCKDSSPVKTESPTITEETDSVTGITTMRGYETTDTVRINGALYRYTFNFAPDDSLPVIVNTVGQTYRDNMVRLTIKKDSTTIYAHTFTKKSFEGIVPKKFMATSALVGFNYNITKTDNPGKFFFIATVGDPDETAELSFPMEVIITTDGQMNIIKAENIETEPIIHGMTVDPEEDGA